MRAAILTFGLAFSIAACQTTTEPAAEAIAPAVAKTSMNARPGGQKLSLDSAVDMFNAICVGTLPKFNAAPTRLSSMGFVQNPNTTTYYHPKLNLSFKLDPPKGGGACSMVFVSNEKPTALGLGLAGFSAAQGRGGSVAIGLDPISGASATKTKGGGEMRFTPMGRNGGDDYFHVLLLAAK